MKFIDLHSHTHHTDGRHSVAEVLSFAEQAELSLFSISDHNDVTAYHHIAENRRLFSGEILPAVELSTLYNGEGIEVLGYGVDIGAIEPFIKKNYMLLPEKQVAEGRLLARLLPEKGLKFSDEFIEQMLRDPESFPELHDLGSRPMFLKELRRFPENARFFESEEDFLTMPRQRWQRHYLHNPKNGLFIDQSSLFPTLREVIDVIHRAGGLAFLAHAFVYSPTIVAALEEMIADYDLDGLECHYGTYTPEQKKYMSDFCDAHGLLKSGGSDFHGYDMRPDNIMGFSAGERIDKALVAPWLSKVKTI